MAKLRGRAGRRRWIAPRRRVRRGRDREGRVLFDNTRLRFAPNGSAGLIAAAIIALGAGASLALSWPGHLSYDSVVQLAEGRAGVYEGAHPPVMSWLLGIADALRPGAAIFVVFDTVLIAGALVSFVALGRKPTWPTAVLALAFAAVPQLLIYPSIVWKDVLFAASATAGFACLAHAAANWERLGRRTPLLAATVLLLTVAALARQNGAVVLPIAAAAVGWIAARGTGAARARRGLVHGLAFLSAAAVLTVAATIGLTARSEVGAFPRGPWEGLQAYDLVNALALAPATDLPVLRSKDPWLETLLRADGVAAYSPIRANALEAVLDRAATHGDSADLIAAQWEDLIVRHPLIYARARARTFQWVFLTPDRKNCVLIFTGVSGPAEEMADAGLVPRDTALDDALETYALGFAGTPVYSHAAYGALGLVLLAVLLRRGRAPDIAVAAMLAAALAFAMSFAVISIACDYRYLYDLDLAAMAGALYAAATWKGVF